MPRYDAILIPGGGVREGGALPTWVKRRLDWAIQVQQGEYILTLSAGTVHKPPPVDENAFPIFESVAAADYLVRHGIDPRKVLVETSSYDTIGNAYFARVIHVDPRGFSRLLVITSAFHMPRTESIFRWVYGLDAPPNGYELYFEQVTDQGIDEGVLRSRVDKERSSLQRLLDIQSKIGTLRQFHEWLFSEHGAYSVSMRPSRAAGQVIDTY